MQQIDKVLELVRAGMDQDVIKAVLGITAEAPAPKKAKEITPVDPIEPAIEFELEPRKDSSGYHKFTPALRRLLIGALFDDDVLDLTHEFYRRAKEAGYSDKTVKVMYGALSRTVKGKSQKYLDGVYGELINEYRADPQEYLKKLETYY